MKKRKSVKVPGTVDLSITKKITIYKRLKQFHINHEAEEGAKHKVGKHSSFPIIENLKEVLTYLDETFEDSVSL